MSDAASHDGPPGAPSKKGAEAELLLISEAVERLKVGMYDKSLSRPEPIAEIKKSKQGTSVEWGPQKEDAAERIREACLQGELSVFVPSASTESATHRTHLRVRLGVLKRMIPTRGGLPDDLIASMRPRGGLPDDPIASMRRLAEESLTPELRAALSKGLLYVGREEFDAWYKEAKKKRNWPSQRSSRKPRMGRPSKERDLRNPIIALTKDGRWSAEKNSIADLVRLLKSRGVTASRQTVERAVEQLHRETGDRRYYCADPRKRPDDSVWGSFEDLMRRRRRQYLKNDQKS